MKKISTTLLALLFSAGVFAAGHTVSITSSNATCHGMCDGSATANVSGGVGPFSFSWTSGVATATTTGLCAGNYTVTVTDSSDMSTATAIASITEPPAITITMSPITACSGSCVTLTPTVMGGTPAYTFSWSPAASLSSPVIASPVSCPTSSTTYTLYITDADGCIASGTVTVSVDGPITSGITSTNTSACVSTMCNGSVSIAPVGGSAPYMYLWNDLAGSTTATISGLCAGTYAANITDVNGCTTTDSVTISAPSITSNYTMVPDSASGFNYWAFNTSTGDSLSYIWYFGDGDSSFVRSPLHTYAAAGTYNVCLIVSNPGGCFDVKCTSVTVTGVANSCLSLFNISHDTASGNPNAYTVYNLSYGSTLSYLWDFGDSTTSTLQNPTHIYAGTGSYQLCLTVDNGAGCNQMYCDSLTWVDSLGHASIPLTVTVVGAQSPTGITEHVLHSEVNVYPNPFNDNTTFMIQSEKPNEVYSFELTDVLGKKVRSLSGINRKEFQISREGLQNGIYFYKIIDAESTVGIGKLIIE
ncbi:MAG: PKD domain-containing protein [Bacteroidia bacterium]